MRCFLAVPLPSAILEAIADLQRSLRPHVPDLRWVRPEGMHLTILFLGEIDPEAASPLLADLAAGSADLSPGSASLRGLGLFPVRGRPRVLWIGVEEEGPPTLAPLHRAALAAARSRGWQVEDRGYRPHVTLARARGPLGRRSVEAGIGGQRDVELGSVPLERCILYRSILGPGGARHEELGAVRLGAAA
ncbi:MAG: RNA 2',3'-cyclic phosphodiesterase [Acidobacteriota bacterium]|jgi:2'-5' RNA ligase